MMDNLEFKIDFQVKSSYLASSNILLQIIVLQQYPQRIWYDWTEMKKILHQPKMVK